MLLSDQQPPAQRHPLYEQDRPIVDRLLRQSTPTDLDIVDCARLANRYSGFPGHPDLMADLRTAASTWGFDRSTLNAASRAIWAGGFRPLPLEDELVVGSGADAGAS